MPFVPAADTVRVEVRAVLNTQNVENTLYFLNQSPPNDAAAVEACVEALAAAWRAEMLPTLPNSYIIREFYGADFTTESGPVFTDPALPGDTGALVVTPVPNNVSFRVKFNTGLRGRSYRGGNYVAGLDRAEVSGNLLGSTRANILLSAYQDIADAMDTAGWTLVVASFFTGGAPRVAAVVTPVTSISYTDLVVDSQRRRLPGRGE